MKKHYYEIWFYFYGDEDTRNELDKEYTFYIKTEGEIKTKEELIKHLKKNFPVNEKYNVTQINCIPEKDLDNISTWFEITGKQFTDGCGIEA